MLTYCMNIHPGESRAATFTNLDVPEALQQIQHAECEWRIHYHVPVFAEKFGNWKTTRFWTETILPLFSEKVLLEIKTYTWSVQPQELRTTTVTDSIVKEIR